ncbi:EpsG family protein [Pectobacterium sp. A5351]|uniref:EpsG family protein n=1 Tax=Pectobacterium sp. A5351 TaxID=2914983 RepID=UPI00232F3064|nr:EpsG family protein [Pectobacterium sp. A5351]WCG81947.1 EpsG family protein [Pectobacterium sp. A5351]
MRRSDILKIPVISVLMLVLSCVAGTRFFGPDPDFSNYVDMLTYPNYIDRVVDLFFQFMVFLNTNLFPNYWVVFFIYAILGVSIKTIAIFKYSEHPGLSYCVYIMMFYLLHEYTQIRGGVAAGILLFSFYYIYIGDFKKFIASISIASLFHLSSLVVLPFYFFVRNYNLRSFFFVAIVAFLFAIFSYFSGDFVRSIVHAYMSANDSGINLGAVLDFNLLNKMNLSHFIIALICYFFYVKGMVFKQSELSVVYIKLLFVGVGSFYFFGALGLVATAYRISYIFLPVLIFIIPMLLYTIKPRVIPFVFIVLYLLINLLYLVDNVIWVNQ